MVSLSSTHFLQGQRLVDLRVTDGNRHGQLSAAALLKDVNQQIQNVAIDFPGATVQNVDRIEQTTDLLRGQRAKARLLLAGRHRQTNEIRLIEQIAADRRREPRHRRR